MFSCLYGIPFTKVLFVFTLRFMNIDILKHNRIKSPLHMSYASKGTAFWDTCYNSYDYVILVNYMLFVNISTSGCPLSNLYCHKLNLPSYDERHDDLSWISY